jgi:hypothetical protein
VILSDHRDEIDLALRRGVTFEREW